VKRHVTIRRNRSIRRRHRRDPTKQIVPVDAVSPSNWGRRCHEVCLVSNCERNMI
jgi:hypothetical protein